MPSTSLNMGNQGGLEQEISTGPWSSPPLLHYSWCNLWACATPSHIIVTSAVSVVTCECLSPDVCEDCGADQSKIPLGWSVVRNCQARIARICATTWLGPQTFPAQFHCHLLDVAQVLLGCRRQGIHAGLKNVLWQQEVGLANGLAVELQIPRWLAALHSHAVHTMLPSGMGMHIHQQLCIQGSDTAASLESPEVFSLVSLHCFITLFLSAQPGSQPSIVLQPQKQPPVENKCLN